MPALLSRKFTTWGALVSRAAAELGGSAEARRDAEYLLAFTAKVDRSYLYAHRDDDAANADQARFRQAIEARARGVPVAYITGRKEFYGRTFAVSRQCLIPRPETESLVESALTIARGRGNRRILDLGTGSGIIAVTLAAELAPGRGGRASPSMVATDISATALALARHNAHTLGVRWIDFRAGDLFGPVAGDTFDLIISNPPYVETGFPGLDDSEIRHEPRTALVGGEDGLEVIRRIIRDVPGVLAHDGHLLLEHAPGQAAAVEALMKAAGFEDVTAVRSPGGIRCGTQAIRPGASPPRDGVGAAE